MDEILFPILTEEDKKLPFFMKSVGIRANQEHVLRRDGYPDYHWLHCSKGSGILILEHKEYQISQDMGFFLHPNVPHEYFSQEEPWVTHWVTFDGFAVENLLENLGLGRVEVFYLKGRQFLDNALHHIYLAGINQVVSRNYECSSLLYNFLLSSKEYICRENNRLNSSVHLRLHPIIKFMEENFNKQVSLEDMSSIINITPGHLCRLFKQAYNVRPFIYLSKYRIQKAKEYIINSENPQIKEVAFAVGYNDTSYFCAIFKEYEGMTPLEFKSMHKII